MQVSPGIPGKSLAEELAEEPSELPSDCWARVGILSLWEDESLWAQSVLVSPDKVAILNLRTPKNVFPIRNQNTLFPSLLVLKYYSDCCVTGKTPPKAAFFFLRKKNTCSRFTACSRFITRLDFRFSADLACNCWFCVRAPLPFLSWGSRPLPLFRDRFAH